MPTVDQPDPTPESVYLVALAERVAATYVAHAGPRAILLTGSAAAGVSDRSSDLDLIMYYDALPSDAARRAAREALGATASPSGGGPGSEAFDLRGVEVQIGHTTVAGWERTMATVLEAFNPGTTEQKGLEGLLTGRPLHGADLVRAWQLWAAAYPDGLARAMVAHYLTFFPFWLVQDRLASRNTGLWLYQALAEASLNLLGVLAGLNRVYYSTFQFKRLGAFAARLRIAPERLADRLDALFVTAVADPAGAAIEVERMVAETVVLVEAHRPEVDTAAVRAQLGRRERPWTPTPGVVVRGATPGTPATALRPERASGRDGA